MYLCSVYSTLVLSDGTITAAYPNPAVPVGVLKQIMQWEAEGASRTDIIDRLRCKTVPKGHSPHSWSDGEKMYSKCMKRYYSE